MPTMRRKIAALLESREDKSALGKLIDGFLVTLIILNILAVIIESVESIFLQYQHVFWAIELFSVGVFTLEYLLRLWTCVDMQDPRYHSTVKGRLRWAFSPLGLIDLLAIMPFYVQVFLIQPGSSNWLILRALRGFRILRIFKLTRFSPGMKALVTVLKQESATLAVAGFILFILVILSSWGIYALEHDAQPEEFSSIPAAMWWTVVTLTTLGYGDVVPITSAGKVFAGFIALMGIGMLALPAGILASGFSAEIHRRKDAFEQVAETIITDGIISISEARELEQYRESLGLSKEQAQSLIKTAERDRRKQHADTCPHCGKSLTNELANKITGDGNS